MPGQGFFKKLMSFFKRRGTRRSPAAAAANKTRRSTSAEKRAAAAAAAKQAKEERNLATQILNSIQLRKRKETMERRRSTNFMKPLTADPRGPRRRGKGATLSEIEEYRRHILKARVNAARAANVAKKGATASPRRSHKVRHSRSPITSANRGVAKQLGLSLTNDELARVLADPDYQIE
jgi:hypothetical protein